ncbi:MAG: peptide deformylase [Rhodospirillales bacterium]|nr:peptide deformylase [Rhodospirillales bacterium]MDE2320036.1 peptide deformylase [Rhodospirillales bacterium]
MSILKIARMGHPVLLARAAEVEDATVPEIKALISAMTETMEDAGGVGLAAPQVHVGLRLFVFHVPASRADGGGVALRAVINPVITPVEEAGRELGWEGCLSIPGLRAAVPRWREIRLAGLDKQGQAFEETLSGFAARVVQHEVDHLDGVLYPMRMEDFRLFGYNEELDRYGTELL